MWHTINKINERCDACMTLLRWIGGIVVACWLIGLIFKIGGVMIHWLLLVAAIVFIVDALTGTKTKS